MDNEYILSSSNPPHTITTWMGSDSQPTDEELQNAWNIVKQRNDWYAYQKYRMVGLGTTSGYLGIDDQLDQLYWDMHDGKLGIAATTGNWYIGITSVKNAFPKPS